MPTPRLDVTVRDATVGLSRLEKFRANSKSLPPIYQYMIAELIMLRLFSIVEIAIEDLACKLVAGAPYTNRTHPARLYTAQSMNGARQAMLSYGRSKPLSKLQWTRVRSIRESTSKVLSPAEPFIKYAQVHGNRLDEMRRVRNYVAHRSADSRKEYQQVVRSSYGANSRVRVEVFLTSRQRRPVAKIDEYLATARIMISELAQG